MRIRVPMLAALMIALSPISARAETVVRYGISMADIPLTTGQPDRGAGAYQFTSHVLGRDAVNRSAARQHLGLNFIRREYIYELQDAAWQRPHRRGIQDSNRAARPPLPQSGLRCVHRNFQLCEHHCRRSEGRFAFGDIGSAQPLIRPGVEHDAVASACLLHQDEAHARSNIRGLQDVTSIHALLAEEPQRHLAQVVVSNLGDKTDPGSQPRAAHRLVGTLAAIVHAVAGAQQSFAAAGQAPNLHG